MAPAESGIRPVPRRLLAVNAGSSSIRFALFEAGAGLRKIRDGKLERIGLPGTNLAARAPDGTTTRRDIDAGDHRGAAAALIDWLAAESWVAGLAAIGHRVVHGMRRVEPELVTPALLAQLRALTPYDPEHLPREIALIEDFAA
ncbi:MAG: acetate/propionate family kinase, partial [Gammaproteobacteria bacterium]|nr:acetate/propionate family kinase [Gammaproteobacteria bacterium]